MALVQAYRRTKPYTHAFPDVVLEFKPNEKGDFVCDVKDQSAVDRLLLTPTGFRLYGVQAELPASELLSAKADSAPKTAEILEQVPETASPYVLKDEETGAEFDLRPLDDAALHEFAKANNVKVHPLAKGDTIRDKIVAAFKE